MTSNINTISPELSLDLRLKFLETLLKSNSNEIIKQNLTRKLSLIQFEFKTLLEDEVNSTESLRRFVVNYDLNEPLLRLPPLPPSNRFEDSMNPLEKVALILESETEIKRLEKELREIELLDERGVVGAGNLADHENLKEGLKELIELSPEISSKYLDLEGRTEVLLNSYNNYINTLSEVFINWNDIITSAEDEVTRREKERDLVEDVS